jgi:hypothetical protein
MAMNALFGKMPTAKKLTLVEPTKGMRTRKARGTAMKPMGRNFAKPRGTSGPVVSPVMAPRMVTNGK